jgi:hypothetical protein
VKVVHQRDHISCAGGSADAFPLIEAIATAFVSRAMRTVKGLAEDDVEVAPAS